ncbi:hypothetical protein [Sulfuricurvum sp.]|uniref:hypothetical protein n=1 Tax=Sulfuricurvum sp. TaxID=2025608 RepID=UPI0035644D57
MPIMCIYDLERWLKENDYDYSVCFKPTPEAQAFMKTLDTVIDQILDKLKESKYGGAIAWAKVI